MTLHTELVTEATGDILLAMAEAMGEEDMHPLDDEGVAAVRALAAGDPHARAWLLRAEAQGPVIGYLVLTLGFSIEYGGRDGFIDEIYVAPEARGQGLGRAALEFAEAQARNLGVLALHLEVNHGNKKAQDLYQAEGFFPSGRLLMSKRL